MTRTAALSHRNCDDIFNDGERNDGVFEIFTGSRFTKGYCEFDRENYNWMVKTTVYILELTVLIHLIQ